MNRAHCTSFWSAPAERSDDGALVWSEQRRPFESGDSEDSVQLLIRIVESWFGFVAERRPRVAVGFSPRCRTQRVGVAERRLNGWQMRPLKRRSATRILASGNRGLKPTATVIQSLRDPDRKRSV